MKKVLIITYYWPPGSGAGVQRWLKMSRYLPGFGIYPVILTVLPEYATYPATDYSLNFDIPDNLEVHHTKATDFYRMLGRRKSSIPAAGFATTGSKGLTGMLARAVRGNFFIPDPRRGWNRYAVIRATQLIKENDIDSVITTGPPHSTHLIGLKLKKRFNGIRWIADMRDPWVDIYYYKEFFPSPLAKSIDRHYERIVIQNADMLISVSNAMSRMFQARYPESSAKFTLVRNGYDPADFEGLKPGNPERFTITYVGTISDSYPLNGLIKALLRLSGEGVKTTVRFTGIISGNQRRLLENNLPDTLLEFKGYRPHREAIVDMLNSSVLLLIIPSHKCNNLIVTGKLFEYIASSKPVLVIGPTTGEAAEIISFMPNCCAAGYDDTAIIGDFLSKAASGKLPEGIFLPESFTRREGARIIAQLITNRQA